MATFVASYLIGFMVILGVWGIIAYRKQVERGDIVDDKKTP
jgi:hypothetical protein